jgi:hypothetical protein
VAISEEIYRLIWIGSGEEGRGTVFWRFIKKGLGFCGAKAF